MTERTGKNCKVKTMEIKLVRIAKRQTYTIGALYLDDEPWRLCLADGKQVYITITSSKGCIDPLTD